MEEQLNRKSRIKLDRYGVDVILKILNNKNQHAKINNKVLLLKSCKYLATIFFITYNSQEPPINHSPKEINKGQSTVLKKL